ncbi:MAG: NAD(P)/FAD-dependent oxidoreductase, partial [Desulfobacterales bacterium]
MSNSSIEGTEREYDVIIVGGGPAGMFAAYYLCERSDLRVLLIEMGKEPLKRKCPMSDNQECLGCKPCHILSGIGGAGLFSDGKLNYIHKLGKSDLTQFMPRPQAEALIDETETIFNRFGMDSPVYPTNMAEARRIRQKAKRYGIDLLIIRQKHLGSDCLPGHIAAMRDYIKSKGAVFHTSEEVKDVIVENMRVTGVVTNRGSYRAGKVILAPGRVGANWIGSLAQKYEINLKQRG